MSQPATAVPLASTANSASCSTCSPRFAPFAIHSPRPKDYAIHWSSCFVWPNFPASIAPGPTASARFSTTRASSTWYWPLSATWTASSVADQVVRLVAEYDASTIAARRRRKRHRREDFLDWLPLILEIIAFLREIRRDVGWANEVRPTCTEFDITTQTTLSTRGPRGLGPPYS